jgi:hypothetical protein
MMRTIDRKSHTCNNTRARTPTVSQDPSAKQLHMPLSHYLYSQTITSFPTATKIILHWWIKINASVEHARMHELLWKRIEDPNNQSSGERNGKKIEVCMLNCSTLYIQTIFLYLLREVVA